MSDYIKREDAIKALTDCPVQYVSRICNVPSANVVEVVRCRDCKYWRPDTRPEGSLDERADGLWGIGNLCIKHLPSDQLEAIEFNPDDYCKYGKRKDDECE